jgi:hypothetical protein
MTALKHPINRSQEPAVGGSDKTLSFGTGLVSFVNQESLKNMLQYLTSSSFWEKKIKIAILVIATFIAMC